MPSSRSEKSQRVAEDGLRYVDVWHSLLSVAGINTEKRLGEERLALVSTSRAQSFTKGVRSRGGNHGRRLLTPLLLSFYSASFLT